MIKKILVSFIFNIGFISLFAQNVSDYNQYKTKYRDKDIIFVKVQTEINIDIKKSNLKIEDKRYEETYYNNYKAGSFAEKDVSSNQFFKLTEIKASTLIPNDNKFKEIKVKEFKTKDVLSDKVFYEDITSTFFTYPSLREGSITKMSTTFDILEPRFLPLIFYKRYFPTENFELVINADKDVELGFKSFYADSLKIQFSKQEKGNRIIYSWKANNLIGYKNEPGSPDFRCYLPQIIPYIKSYKTEGKVVPILRNEADLYNWYEKNISKIDRRHSDEMLKIVDSITKGNLTEIEKVKRVFHWVQTNIKYVANEYGLGGFIPRNPLQIFEKRYGDCKDMATIIIEMLDIAKIKAYHTWIGTRDLPYSYFELPTPSVDNHMIATYINDGKYYFLDATDFFGSMFFPTAFIQGKEAMIKKDEDKFEIVKVPVVSAETNCLKDSVTLKIDNDKIIGSGIIDFSGYYFTDGVRKIDGLKDSEDKKKFMNGYLEKGNNKFSIQKYNVKPIDDKLFIDYDFILENYSNKNGNELYINMNLSKPYESTELLKDDRTLDYEFEHKSNFECKFVLDIPSGYESSYLPGNSKFENDKFSYEINYKIENKKIVYNLRVKLNTLLLNKDSFESWNKMLKQIKADYKEVVVLKQIK